MREGPLALTDRMTGAAETVEGRAARMGPAIAASVRSRRLWVATRSGPETTREWVGIWGAAEEPGSATGARDGPLLDTPTRVILGREGSEGSSNTS